MTSDSEEISFEERFNNAEAQAILLDDAYITMKCNDVKSLKQRLDEDEDDYLKHPGTPLKRKQSKSTKISMLNSKQTQKHWPLTSANT